ncbi:MAG: MFS transporter [Rhizobiales bacterium]|nr:MFS transporter [Hyphomicrobiales bacterium]
MQQSKLHFLFLNLGHFLDHLFMLVFATVAALALTREWGLSYAELVAYATPGFVAFGAFALAAGWLADRWSREGMITVFFVGIGAASIVTALATTPLQIAIGLFAIGVFASIYHPVGIALVLEGRVRTGMAVAINGVWGNMGVATAALITGYLIDHTGWRSAFVVPGLVSIAIGVAYGLVIWRVAAPKAAAAGGTGSAAQAVFDRALFIRVIGIVFFTTALGGLVFQSTTFALPKILAERAANLDVSATLIGSMAFLAFAAGSIGQLVVGFFVDRFSPRHAFLIVAALQVTFFALMPGLTGWAAVFCAMAFMFAAFGQIPINDVLVGRVARTQWRSRILAVRYMITISVMAAALPLIGIVHGRWGFDTLFVILAATAAAIFTAVVLLPRQMPQAAAVPAE